MANSHHKGRPHGLEEQSPTEILERIDAFLRTCRAPAVLEYGEELMALRSGEFTLEIRSDRLWIDVWHENRSLSRRILGIQAQAPGTLDCLIHRFGGATGQLTFLDTDRPQTAHRKLKGARVTFAEQFRRMLSRQFPGWELKSLSSAMDLRRSFSPLFPRARLTRGLHQIAAIACPDPAHEPGCLTFALLWFSHLATQSHRKLSSTALHIFLPEGIGALTAHRLRWLLRNELRVKLFLFNSHGSAGEVDPDDLGNLDTSVRSRYLPPQLSPEAAALLPSLSAIPGIGVCPDLSGALGIRFQGIEFARLEQSRASLGLGLKEELEPGEFRRIVEFAARLQELAPEVRPEPERWLESAIRFNIASFDPSLRPEPVHAQVLSIAGPDRNALDLLAVSHDGRVTVLELKTEEDIHLPMQALDYWTGISRHAQRGELDHLFPGIPLRPEPPRLLLVAPALSFHPANETVLRYFSPEIDVERIGINSDWEAKLKVVLRLKRGEIPQSHQVLHEYPGPNSHQEGSRQSQSGTGAQAGCPAYPGGHLHFVTPGRGED